MIAAAARKVVGLLGSSSPAVRLVRPLYAQLLDRIATRSGLGWEVNGAPIRIHPHVRHLIPHVNEPALFRFLQGNIQPNQTVLDVGAFLGAYAVFEALWSGPMGRVICFEPTPGMWRWIDAHRRYNGVEDRVRLIRAAVGERAGQMDFMVNHLEPYRNMAVGALSGGEFQRIQVPVVTLDDVCTEFNVVPDWIRMDVQGFEFDVLKGARRTITRHRTRLKIIMETHPQLWPKLGFHEQDALQTLEELGLRAEPLNGGLKLFEPDGHVVLSAKT